MSIGMHAATGRAIDQIAHLRQSINKILTTPIGSRIERRPFGSLLPELIDHPMTEHLALLLYAATASALIAYEPRFRITRVRLAVNSAVPGKSTLEIDGIAIFGRETGPVSVSVAPFTRRAA